MYYDENGHEGVVDELLETSNNSEGDDDDYDTTTWPWHSQERRFVEPELLQMVNLFYFFLIIFDRSMKIPEITYFLFS